MRYEGKYREAYELLQAHYKDVTKAGKDAFYDELCIERRVKKFLGICAVNGCFKDARNGKTMCAGCLAIGRTHSNSYYQRKREQEENDT